MDRIDQRILALLSRDGRMSYTDLGRECGLSTSAAQQRVRRLEQSGVISGYSARISPVALDRTLTAFIQVRSSSAEHDDVVLEFMETSPEIISCWSIAGDANYLVKVMVRTTADLETLINRFRSSAEVLTVTTVALNTIFADRPLVESPSEEQLPRLARNRAAQ